MSALPKREDAHRLLELVPEEDLPRVVKMLQDLAREEDQVLVALRTAPEDDEAWTPEDEAAWQQGKADVAAGRVMTTEELCRRLGL